MGMQEGGALGSWTREEIELFCIDHLLIVEINCNEESFSIDIAFPTTNVANSKFGSDSHPGIRSIDAVMQIIRGIIVGFRWEQDALNRSKKCLINAYKSLQKSLEGK